MSQYPGIPAHMKVYKVISPRVVVAIFEQGQPPHPNSLDRLDLYVQIDPGGQFEKMGMKINIRSDMDLKRWVQQSIQKRLKTRTEALGRLQAQVHQVEIEKKALEQALASTRP